MTSIVEGNHNTVLRQSSLMRKLKDFEMHMEFLHCVEIFKVAEMFNRWDWYEYLALGDHDEIVLKD
jgi:hypothetical protein